MASKRRPRAEVAEEIDELPAGGDEVNGVVTVSMNFAGDGSAAGTIGLGAAGPLPFTAARQP